MKSSLFRIIIALSLSLTIALLLAVALAEPVFTITADSPVAYVGQTITFTFSGTGLAADGSYPYYISYAYDMYGLPPIEDDAIGEFGPGGKSVTIQVMVPTEEYPVETIEVRAGDGEFMQMLVVPIVAGDPVPVDILRVYVTEEPVKGSKFSILVETVSRMDVKPAVTAQICAVSGTEDDPQYTPLGSPVNLGTTDANAINPFTLIAPADQERLAVKVVLTSGDWSLEGYSNIISLEENTDPEPEPEPEPEPSPEELVPGDVNHDGLVDGVDVLRLMKYLAQEIDPGTGKVYEIVQANADLTGDGKTDEKDLVRLVKYLGGEIASLE